jgi:hypothetical protein
MPHDLPSRRLSSDDLNSLARVRTLAMRAMQAATTAALAAPPAAPPPPIATAADPGRPADYDRLVAAGMAPAAAEAISRVLAKLPAASVPAATVAVVRRPGRSQVGMGLGVGTWRWRQS